MQYLIPQRTSKTTLSVEDDGDGEPVITFESPSKSGKHQTILKEKETSSNNSSTEIFNKKNTPMIKDVNSSKSSNAIRQINSLLSNTSITVRYSSEPLNKNSKNSQDIVVSETDEDSTDENADPLFIGDNLNTSNQTGSDKSSNVNKNSYEVVDLDGVTASTEKTPPERNDSHNEIVIPKKDTVPETLKIRETDVRTESLTQNITDVESPEVLLEKSESIDKVISSEKSTTDCQVNSCTVYTDKKVVFNPFYANSSNENPLKRKFSHLTEKDDEAYLKLSSESESDCIKRIYTLISDWHIALAKYQKTLTVPCRWGLPISVDRQIQDGLVKKSYINQLKKSKYTAAVVYASDISSSSESHVSDQSDEDFEIFPKKKRWKGSKTYGKRNTRIDRETKNSSLKGGLISGQNKKSDGNALSKDTRKENSDARLEILPSCSGISVENVHKDTVSDNNEENSLSLLNYDSNSVSKVQTTYDSRSFESSNLELPDTFLKSANRNSESPELFDTQSTKEILSQNSDTNGNTLESGSSVEISECTNTRKEMLGQGSIKRKYGSNPPNMPPLKKPFRDKDIDVIEEYKDTGANNSPCHSNRNPGPSSSELSIQESTRNTAAALKKAEESSSKNEEGSSHEIILESETPNKEKDVINSQNIETMECPICQKDFLLDQIEAHASECNGMEEPLELNNQKSLGGRRRQPVSQLQQQNPQMRKPQKQQQQQSQDEIEYLETHPKGLNTVSRRGK